MSLSSFRRVLGLRSSAVAGLSSQWTSVAAPAAALQRLLHSSSSVYGTIHVKVPALGESITDGTIAAVLKQAGDSVEEDEPIVQIETDKVTVDVRAPRAGTIEAILVKPDENVAVGHMVASILEAVAGLERPVGAQAQQAAAAASSSVEPAVPAGSGYRPSITFPSRRGPGGEQLSAQPRAAAPAAPAAAPPPPQQAPAQPLRVTVLTGVPAPPRSTISDREMEMIMLGGAEP